MIGWRDLIGDVAAKSEGLTSPKLHNFNGNYRSWYYAPGNRADITYHVPHDYAPGTNMYLHVHWSHNAEFISGTMHISHYVSYAKGHYQEAFADALHMKMVIDCNKVPTKFHCVDEIQISDFDNPSMLDTNLIEPDGIITNSFIVNSTPKLSNVPLGAPACPVFFCVDLHYQSTDQSTLNKQPDFWK